MSTVKRVFVHQFLISSLILLGPLWSDWWTCLTWMDCRVLIPLPVLQRIVGTPSSRMVVLFSLVLCVQVEKPSKASTSSLELTWSCRGTHHPPLTTTPGSLPSEGQFSRWMWHASLSTTRLEYVQQRRPIRVHDAIMMISLISNYLQAVKEVSCCSNDVLFHWSSKRGQEGMVLEAFVAVLASQTVTEEACSGA